VVMSPGDLPTPRAFGAWRKAQDAQAFANAVNEHAERLEAAALEGDDPDYNFRLDRAHVRLLREPRRREAYAYIEGLRPVIVVECPQCGAPWRDPAVTREPCGGCGLSWEDVEAAADLLVRLTPAGRRPA
jgi:hypothetical protein